MGQVWLGQNEAGTPVAIKTLRPDIVDSDAVARFRREARAALQVSSPWTASVYTVDLEGEPPFIATEYVPGDTLAARIDRGGPLPRAQLIAFAAALADGLRVIHRAGVVHRDLSPRNIILSPDGPKIIDLGVAEIAEATRITSSGVAFGTPTSMAPEQVRGQTVGPAADVFAWGVAVAYSATGRLPFGTGRAEAVIYRVVHDDPDLQGLDESVRSLVEAALNKDPSRRPTPQEITGRLTGTRVGGDTDTTVAVTELVRTARLVDTDRVRVPNEERPDEQADTRDRQERTTVATRLADDRRSKRHIGIAVAVLLLVLASGIGAYVALGRGEPTGPMIEAGATSASNTPENAASASPRAQTPTPDSVPETGPEAHENTLPVRLQGLRYQPEQMTCSGDMAPELDGSWQISVPPYPESADTTIEIGLRDKFATHAGVGYEVTVTVLTPDGSGADAHVQLIQDEWNDVWYPSDFVDAPDPTPGTYTVIWRVNRNFVACGGFQLTDPRTVEAPPTYGPGESLGRDPTFFETAGDRGDAPTMWVPANGPCEGGADEPGWTVTACQWLGDPMFLATVWQRNDQWRAVVYDYGEPGPMKAVWDTGVLDTPDYIVAAPELFTVKSSSRESAVFVFHSAGTGEFVDYEIIDATAQGPKIGAAMTTHAPEWQVHTSGFLVEGRRGKVVGDLRPGESGWRIWHRT